MKRALNIVKIGGNVIERPEAIKRFLHLFALLKGPKILVHGGGRRATEIESRLGIRSEYFEGRRITSDQSLDVMIMVYAGLVNKNIVAGLQANQCNAIGLSGADGGSILANKRPVGSVDFGNVGDIDTVNKDSIASLLDAGMTPVFCALTHDGSGRLFNTNADTIASELAISLSANYSTSLYYCFEKNGVLMNKDDDNSVIGHIDRSYYQKLLAEGVFSDGMLPKLHNCFRALESDVNQIFIGNSSMLEPNAEIFTRITL